MITTNPYPFFTQGFRLGETIVSKIDTFWFLSKFKAFYYNISIYFSTKNVPNRRPVPVNYIKVFKMHGILISSSIPRWYLLSKYLLEYNKKNSSIWNGGLETAKHSCLVRRLSTARVSLWAWNVANNATDTLPILLLINYFT